MTVWWHEEADRMRAGLSSFVRRHASFDPALADDIVAQATVEIARRLSDSPQNHPASWFGDDPPPLPDVRRFRALAKVICKRRLYDQLRRHYLLKEKPWPSAATTAISAEDHAADRELLRLIAQAIDTLDPEDRELIIRGMERGPEEPALTGSERVRLSRLRRQLGAVVETALQKIS